MINEITTRKTLNQWYPSLDLDWVIFPFIFLALFAGCSDEGLSLPGKELENEYNDNCEGKGFTYINDVAHILKENCTLSGCHISGNEEGLPDFTTYQNVFEYRGAIGSRVGSRVMPPPTSGISLEDNEINAIVCWVKMGAPQ